MRTTKLFKYGNSQAVRLPKDFQSDADEVEIFKQNDTIVIREIPKNIAKAFETLSKFSKDCFSNKRDDPPPQKVDFFE